MWTKLGNFEVIVLCILSLIPWPGPSIFKIKCSRENGCIVRKIVQSKWLPILEKYHVNFPLECPFHPVRDIFGPQQLAKIQNRPSQWTCGFCGKSFYDEKHLDGHFENRHRNNINIAEDAICLADYCDIMRCEVLVTKDGTLTFIDSNIISTDIEIWNEANAYRTELAQSSRRDLAKLVTKSNFLPLLLGINRYKTEHIPKIKKSASTCNNDVEKSNNIFKSKDQEAHLTYAGNDHTINDNLHKITEAQIHKEDDDDDDDDINEDDEDDDDDDDDDDDGEEGNNTKPCSTNFVDSTLPPLDKTNQNYSDLQKMKANCKTEELDKLRKKCEILVRDCIVSLLFYLSVEDFKSMEDELNRAVCWYLTCERYWEDGQTEQKQFPWALVLVLVFILSLGVCFCYYIIWILFDGNDENNRIEDIYQTNPHFYNQQQQHQHQHQPQQHLHTTTSLTRFDQNSDGIPSTSISNYQQMHENPYSGGTSTGPPEEVYMTPEFNDVNQSDHYIYVTYPPELKRRLFESCYNRTTRL